MEGATIRRLSAGDEREVGRFEEAFDLAVDPALTQAFLHDPRHHLIVAYVDGEPAGFVSATEIFHPDKQPELFLNEIAVIERLRNRGAGSALVEELKQVARELRCASIWVLTHEDNLPAMAMYRRTGGHWDGKRSVMFEYVLTEGA